MFVFPDLVIESIIRDGLENVRRDLSIVDDLFGSFTQSHLNKKYGDRELNKIKKFVQNRELSVVHAFNSVTAKLPCISIQLLDDTEDEAHNFMDDFEDDMRVGLTDEELEAIVVLDNIQPTAYNANSGLLSFPDTVNLAPVYANLLYEDAAGVQHSIVGGINNNPGNKKLGVQKTSNVDISGPGRVVSSLNFAQYEKRGTIERETVLLGIHTEDQLLTIYIYNLVKYFLLSRKLDLITRGMQKTTFSGSDFTRNLNYTEPVYSRYLTISGMVQNSWTSEKVELIDNIITEVLVDRDERTTEDLGLEDSTVKVSDK